MKRRVDDIACESQITMLWIAISILSTLLLSMCACIAKLLHSNCRMKQILDNIVVHYQREPSKSRSDPTVTFEYDHNESDDNEDMYKWVDISHDDVRKQITMIDDA